MNFEQLQKFCGTISNPEWTRKPFSFGKFTFATNGHLIIRIPRIVGVSGEACDTNRVLELWPKEEPVEFIPIPAVEVPPMGVCPECKGRKDEEPGGECPECGGSGDVEFSNLFNDYEIECASCAGLGSALRMSECGFCNYTGLVEVFKAVPCGGAGFQSKYLAMLAELPNCKIATFGPDKPALFRFDGGDGLLMPCRPDTYQTQDQA